MPFLDELRDFCLNKYTIKCFYWINWFANISKFDGKKVSAIEFCQFFHTHNIDGNLNQNLKEGGKLCYDWCRMNSKR